MWDKAGGFYNAGPYTPFMFHKDGDPPRSTIQLPGGTGGVNWGGAAADVKTGWVYVNAQATSLVGWVEKGSSVTVFAMNMDCKNESHIAARMTVTQQCLADIVAY